MCVCVCVCVLQTLQAEHDLLVSKVDAVRDTAMEVIAHSTRYSKTVEPQLTLLNQRWQEVTNRLKVSASSANALFLCLYTAYPSLLFSSSVLYFLVVGSVR